MELYHAGLSALRIGLLLAGSSIVFAGVALAALEALRTGSGRRVAEGMLAHASLGLEFFVGATLLNLTLEPTWTAVGITAVTILARRLITLFLDRSAREG
jgi:uncharacterized membrane protein